MNETTNKRHLIWESDPCFSEEQILGVKKDFNDVFNNDLSYEQAVSQLRIENEYDLEDQKVNLDIVLDGPIIVIARLGLWNGKSWGYKSTDWRTIGEIFFSNCSGCSVIEFFGEEGDIWATEYHHDGTNQYLYREIKDESNISELEEKIYLGTVTKEDIDRYTKSIYPQVAEVYGWTE